MTTPRQDYISETQEWIQNFVIGLDLCPFAALPMSNHQVLFAINQEKDNVAIANHVLELAEKLSEKNLSAHQTAFLITPDIDLSFEDYYELSLAIQQILDDSFLREFVLVAFHPEFRYQDHEHHETANATNRSPYPKIHILKESSLAFAAQSADVKQIVERNQIILSKMSWDQIKTFGHNT